MQISGYLNLTTGFGFFQKIRVWIFGFDEPRWGRVRAAPRFAVGIEAEVRKWEN